MSDITEKFKKLIEDQKKTIRKQEERIQRLKQREEEKACLFRIKEQEKIRRLKQREQREKGKSNGANSPKGTS